jgi:DNA-binding MarR family transcriptional regulator
VIEGDILKVMGALGSARRNEIGEGRMNGDELRNVVLLSPAEINDAIEILEERGLVKVFKALGTAPFKFYQVTLTARGRLEIGKIHPSREPNPENRSGENKEWDLFVCHASEDKGEIVRPLVDELKRAGYRVWYDELEMKLGDNLRRSIDKGLASSRYGLVILSPSFFAKEWPQTELDGLAARERDGEKVILPVWHKVDQSYVRRYSPTLANRYAAKTSNGIASIVEEVQKVVRPSKPDTALENIDHVQAYLFFPRGTPEQNKNLDYHAKNLHHRLIVDLKTTPANAYFLTPGSAGWELIRKHPEMWISWVVNSDEYSIDDPDFSRIGAENKDSN